MNTDPPNASIHRSSASSLKAGIGGGRKLASLRDLLPVGGGKRFPPHFPPEPGASVREPEPIPHASEPEFELSRRGLGRPMNIAEVSRLIGCSPWTVRQTLIPRGLPHFRFKASGRLTFYRDQVIRWIETQQQGGKTTK